MENGRREIVRWYAKKVNIGNYENLDFGCSEKAEVDEHEAHATGIELQAFCEDQVERDIAIYRKKEDAKKNEGARKFERRGNAKQSAELDAGQNDFGTMDENGKL